MNDPVDRRRRGLLLGLAAVPVSGLAALVPTPSATEGPFYPTRGMRYPDIDNDLVRIDDKVRQANGEIVRFGGRLLDTRGQPIAGARIEIWQCDANGRYLHSGDRGGRDRDAGFQGFGFDLTSAAGEYSFRTIKPVPYSGRTPHIHAQVLVDGRARLTTQFYLPDHPGNDRDWLYRRVSPAQRELVTLRFAAGADYPQAQLDIVI